jgi:hypothetical protein
MIQMAGLAQEQTMPLSLTGQLSLATSSIDNIAFSHGVPLDLGMLQEARPLLFHIYLRDA